jgi:hypothetical protein
MDNEPVAPPKNKGGRPKGPSRDKLMADNAELKTRLERLEAAFAARPEPTEDPRLKDAVAELQTLPVRTIDPTLPRGKPPVFVPYSGYVRAKENCVIGCYRMGPNPDQGRVQGDVFAVEVPVLWSDDPYEPVNIIRTRDDGQLECEVRRDVPIIDARWRVLNPNAQNPMARAI